MVLRGRGDSPVHICEPCKKLAEAAGFELRQRRRAGRGIFLFSMVLRLCLFALELHYSFCFTLDLLYYCTGYIFFIAHFNFSSKLEIDT